MAGRLGRNAGERGFGAVRTDSLQPLAVQEFQQLVPKIRLVLDDEQPGACLLSHIEQNHLIPQVLHKEPLRHTCQL